MIFFQFVLLKLYRENNEYKQKEAGIGPFLKNNLGCRNRRLPLTSIETEAFKSKVFARLPSFVALMLFIIANNETRQ